jgi:hypothetical protein
MLLSASFTSMACWWISFTLFLAGVEIKRPDPSGPAGLH